MIIWRNREAVIVFKYFHGTQSGVGNIDCIIPRGRFSRQSFRAIEKNISETLGADKAIITEIIWL